MMFHGHCPGCHHHSLGLAYPTPPDWLSADEMEGWKADPKHREPIAVECGHCGWRDDQ